jgi:hypothetical protein
VLQEFQDICLDDAIYQSLLDSARTLKDIDRSKWVVSVLPGMSIQFVCLSDPANIRTLKVEQTASTFPASDMSNLLEVRLRIAFLRQSSVDGQVVSWLLSQP